MASELGGDRGKQYAAVRNSNACFEGLVQSKLALRSSSARSA